MSASNIRNVIRKLVGKNYTQVGKYTYGFEHIRIHFPSANLKIGKFCSIADNVELFLGVNHNFDFISTYPFGHTEVSQPLSQPISKHPVGKGDVLIGHDVWIGSGVSIMSGISVGDGAVLAARSHIVNDVPPYAIYGGNPAKLIRMRFSDEVISLLSQIEWWNFTNKKIKEVVPLLTTNDVNVELLTKLLSYKK